MPRWVVTGPRRHAALVALLGGAHRRAALGRSCVHPARAARAGRRGRAARRGGGAPLAVPHAADVEAPAMIAATLELSAAARKGGDAVVIGAGPAGSLAARERARRGRAAVVVGPRAV